MNIKDVMRILQKKKKKKSLNLDQHSYSKAPHKKIK